MSQFVSTNYAQIYSPLVKQVYQDKMTISGNVTVINGVKGNAYRFNRVGTATSYARNPTDPVVVSNLKYDQPIANLTNHTVADYSAVIDNIQLSFDEKQVIAISIGTEASRRLDQVIFDKLTATIPSLTTDFNNPKMRVLLGNGTLPASATTYTDAEAKPFDYNGFNAVVDFFDEQGVDFQDRYIALDSRAYANLRKDDRFINNFYVDNKPVMTGVIGSIMGIKIMPIGARPNSMGLSPISFTGGSKVGKESYAFSKSAIGLAIGTDFMSNMNINYIPERRSYLIAGDILAGSALIDPSGVIKIAHYTI